MAMDEAVISGRRDRDVRAAGFGLAPRASVSRWMSVQRSGRSNGHLVVIGGNSEYRDKGGLYYSLREATNNSKFMISLFCWHTNSCWLIE